MLLINQKSEHFEEIISEICFKKFSEQIGIKNAHNVTPWNENDLQPSFMSKTISV